MATLREHAFLASAPELTSTPELVSAWVASLTGADPFTLVIIPGGWEPERVLAELVPVLESAGCEDPTSPDVSVLTGPLSDADYARLGDTCKGLYGTFEAPAALA